jgi:hypothetical protein
MPNPNPSGPCFRLAALLASVSFGLVSVAVAVPQVVPGEAGPRDAARSGFLAENPGTRFLFEDTVHTDRILRVFGRAFSHGATPSESAERFRIEGAPLFGVNAADLLPTGIFPDGTSSVPLSYDADTGSFRFTLIGYGQHVNGIPVFRSDLRVLVRNEPGFPATLASSSLRDLGDAGRVLAATAKPLPPSRIADSFLMKAIGGQFRMKPALTGKQQVIWAGTDDEVLAPRLAYHVIAEGGLLFDPDNYRKFLYIVDAETGRILFQENQVCNVDVVGVANASATQGWGADLCGPEVLEGLPYAKVTAGGVVGYTDAAGNFTISVPATGTIGVVSALEGLYFRVADSSGTAVSSATGFFTGSPITVSHNANTADAAYALKLAQANAYIESNVVRDLVMAMNPAYPVIAGQTGANAFQINANIANSCNAFYNGSSINFYQAGGGCANTAFSTVVHHEFGHHVVNSGGSGQGAYGEGMGDVLGVLVSDTSALAIGFNSNCASGIRNAANSCQYSATGCSSCGSAIHSCGQLLSGCVWDLRTNLLATKPETYRQITADLAINSVPLHGPVTTIDAAICVDFLTLDDTDSDIGNGTPHYNEIASAFEAHGIPAPDLELIALSFPNGIPVTVMPDGTTQIAMNVTALTGQPNPGSGTFHWRVGSSGPFTAVPMTPAGGNSYVVSVPATTCLSQVQFYFSAMSGTATITSPANAPNAPNGWYSATSASTEVTVFTRDFEDSLVFFTSGAPGDNATAGLWVLVDPNGTAAQPENDRTPAPGVRCWVTGQGSPGGALGEADVDGGTTTLISQAFDATGYDAAVLSYWRWYSNDRGASPNTDSMPIQISNDNGSTWVTLETVTENANAWVFKQFTIDSFVTPTASMRLRFLARDLGSGSLVEAGVDDVRVGGFTCAAPVLGDLNGDGLVSAQDLAALLAGWGQTGPTDLNGSGSTDASDMAILLANWTG